MKTYLLLLFFFLFCQCENKAKLGDGNQKKPDETVIIDDTNREADTTANLPVSLDTAKGSDTISLVEEEEEYYESLGKIPFVIFDSLNIYYDEDTIPSDTIIITKELLKTGLCKPELEGGELLKIFFDFKSEYYYALTEDFNPRAYKLYKFTIGTNRLILEKNITKTVFKYAPYWKEYNKSVYEHLTYYQNNKHIIFFSFDWENSIPFIFSFNKTNLELVELPIDFDLEDCFDIEQSFNFIGHFSKRTMVFECYNQDILQYKKNKKSKYENLKWESGYIMDYTFDILNGVLFETKLEFPYDGGSYKKYYTFPIDGEVYVGEQLYYSFYAMPIGKLLYAYNGVTYHQLHDRNKKEKTYYRIDYKNQTVSRKVIFCEEEVESFCQEYYKFYPTRNGILIAGKLEYYFGYYILNFDWKN